MVAWEDRKPQSHLVNFGLNSASNWQRELKERAVKTRVINLLSRAHPGGNQGFRTRGFIPVFISCSDSRMADSNSCVKSNWSSTKSLSQSRIWRNSAGESFSSSDSICSTLLTAKHCRAKAEFQGLSRSKPAENQTNAHPSSEIVPSKLATSATFNMTAFLSMRFIKAVNALPGPNSIKRVKPCASR